LTGLQSIHLIQSEGQANELYLSLVHHPPSLVHHLRLTVMELTQKEKIALEAFQEGMDEPNAGWLHEIAPFDGKELSGVVSSLVKKGVITSDGEEINQDPSNVCYWIQVCNEWKI